MDTSARVPNGNSGSDSHVQALITSAGDAQASSGSSTKGSVLTMIRIIGLALALATGVALPPPTRSAPPLSVTDYGYMLGSWKGAGSFARTGAKVESELNFTTTASGEAVELHERELPPNKFTFTALWTADTVNGGLVMLLAGNNGGGGRLLRSPGWRGDCLIFIATPQLRAWFASEKFTFCRGPRDTLTVEYDLSRDGATWVTGDTQTYHRVPVADGSGPSLRDSSRKGADHPPSVQPGTNGAWTPEPWQSARLAHPHT